MPHVPEAGGAWGLAFSALYRRVRSRSLHQRDLATTVERFRSAAEALPEGMVILDATNRIEWANARAQAHLGIDLAKDIGAPLLNFVRQPEVVRYFEIGDFTDAVVVDSLREPGTTLSIQVVPFGIEERLLISRNITQLEAVARMRRDFIANVSHELKTPLTVVSGFIETLQDLDLEPRQRARYLQLMAEQAKSMQRLVDDLLTLSALESDQNALAEAEFDVVPLLLRVSADAKALSAGRHAVALDIADHAIVIGSRDELCERIRQPGEQRDPLHAGRRGDHARLARRRGRPRRIQRDRHGHRHRARARPAPHRALLPRRSQPLAARRAARGSGLAIVKHVLLRHQAELDVMSELGTGSTFIVILPARRVRRAAANAAPTKRLRTRARRNRKPKRLPCLKPLSARAVAFGYQ